MEENNDHALDLEMKLYTIEEFGADNDISNTILAEIFLVKYPVYSCNIKKSKNHITQKNCGCC